MSTSTSEAAEPLTSEKAPVHRITLIPGDGIGPEVTAAVVRILEAAGVRIEWDEHDAGISAFKRTGTALPTELLDSVRRNKVAMKLGDGLFLASVRAVARDYPDIQYEERIVDATCTRLVMDPAQFDVLLLPNLYGDIVSDLCAGLVGGLGVVPGANLGEQAAVFEHRHIGNGA